MVPAILVAHQVRDQRRVIGPSKDCGIIIRIQIISRRFGGASENQVCYEREFARSLGDGQIDFRSIFSKLTRYEFPAWAVVEWECALKHPEDGARAGAQVVRDHIIRTTDPAFDDFGDSGESSINAQVLGLNRS